MGKKSRRKTAYMVRPPVQNRVIIEAVSHRDLGQPESISQAIDAYKYDSSPVQRFIRERIVFGEGGSVGSKQLFEAFQRFCDEEGLRYQQSRNSFGNDLANVLVNDYGDEGVGELTRMTIGGVRDYYRTGMALSRESENDNRVVTFTDRAREAFA